MNKKLLFSTLAGACALMGANTVSAETKAYFFEEIGEVMGVADNGQYVAISDIENLRGYVWNLDNPDSLTDITITTEDESLPSSQIITGVSLMDFSNDGMGVGSVYFKDGKQKAAYYEDGKWKYLPIHEFVMNTAEAIAVTPDGKTIAGVQFIKDESSEIKGRYYPCQWFRNEEGTYDMVCYTDIELPDHQGFTPLTQNVDGTIIGGRLFCGAGSTIPALLNNGELQYFDELESIIEPFEYKGEIIGYYEEHYINGYHDGATGDFFEGGFDNCDENGNFYGMRTRVFNLTESGGGNLVTKACIYNVNSGEWIDSDKITIYTAGIGTDLLFNGSAGVTKDGETNSIKVVYDFETDHTITGVSKISANAGVIGGMWQELNPATGENTYYPFILETDDARAEIEAIAAVGHDVVIVSAGCISTANGSEATVYNLDGKVVGCGTSVSVVPGIYVVRIGDYACKIAVR